MYSRNIASSTENITGSLPRTLFPAVLGLVLGAVISLLICWSAQPVLAAAKGAVLNISPNAPVVEIDASVMTIDVHRSFLWVGERKIFVSRFRHAGRLQATRLHDKNGRRIRLENFKSGQRVYVRGYVRPAQGIVADSIQQLPPYAGTVQMQLKPLRPVL